MLNLQELKDCMPSKMRNLVTESTLERVNAVADGNEELISLFRDNMMNYETAVSEGKYTSQDYVNAIMFVTFKNLGYTDIDAYSRVFPDRYKEKLAKGYDRNRIAVDVSAYTHNKLVQTLINQMMIPVWLLNQPYVQKAINVQVDLMENSTSDLVRQKAAESLMNYLKKPEAASTLEINIKQTSEMKIIEEKLTKIVDHQLEAISQGAKLKDVIDVEYTENN